MHHRILTGCLAAAIATTACAQQETRQAELTEGSYALTEGGTAELGKNIRVTLDSVNDSRCPKGVMCVAKGVIAYHFTLHTKGAAEQFTLSEDEPAYSPGALSSVRLTIDPGQPEAAVRAGEPRPAYSVSLHVARK